MTGLSSVASLSLGLSMSMSSGTAKLQSQLSTIAAPSDAPVSSKHHQAGHGTSTVLPPPSTADRGAVASPSPRPGIKRQAAVSASSISDRSREDPSPTSETEKAQDEHVTVMSF